MTKNIRKDVEQGSEQKQGHHHHTPPALSNPLEVFFIFLKLGLTSFGGPVAHIGFFHQEFVARRKWLDERSYADLVALCQTLPGPASSQVGLAVGLSRAGLTGALAAWTGFTLPSALALILFAFGMETLGSEATSDWIRGLKIAAVAVVAVAVLGMMRSLAPDKERATLVVIAAIIAIAIPTSLGQISAILLGAAVGLTFLKNKTAPHTPAAMNFNLGRKAGALALALFFALLLLLPLLATEGSQIALYDKFYRAGSLVFGGGHVVLPLLQAELVPTGLLTSDQFLAGYGAAQAVPGPLFTFAAYLGAVFSGWQGAVICLIGIFTPSFLLVIGVLPFWEELRQKRWAQSVLIGVNAAVVGLLLAALYTPVWTSAINSSADFAIGIAAFLALQIWKVPPWLVVALSALIAAGLSRLPLLF